MALTVAAGLNEATSKGDHPSNLLHLSVEAVRCGATVGEITSALEKVWGRHVAVSRVVRGVYREGMNDGANKEEFSLAMEEVAAFSQREGRQPRLLVAKMGQDGHDRGAKIIASSFADMGFDVDLGALFSTPEEVAQQAIDSDCHIVGISSQAAGHRTLVPALIEQLKAKGGGDIRVIVGGVIPPQDYDMLRAAGVVGIFGPGTKVASAARDILRSIPVSSRID